MLNNHFLFKTVKYFKKYVHNSGKIHFKNIIPIYPPPGNNLQLP